MYPCTRLSRRRPPVRLAGADPDRHPVLYVEHRVRVTPCSTNQPKEQVSYSFSEGRRSIAYFRPLYSAPAAEVLARADDIQRRLLNDDAAVDE